MANIEPAQLRAAESVLRAYITDTSLSASAIFLEALTAFNEAAAKRERKKTVSKRKIPDDCPDQHGREMAQAYWSKAGRHDLTASLFHVIEEFRAHHIARGTTMESWPQAWVTWYRNALKFNKPSQPLALIHSSPNIASASIETWVKRLEMYAGFDGSKSKTWLLNSWGPEPKTNGCLVPDEAYTEFRRIHPRRAKEG